MSARRPLADGNLVTVTEIMAEAGVSRPVALRLVDGLPSCQPGRHTLYRWGDVVRAIMGMTPAELADEPVDRRHLRRASGDWA